MKKQSSTSSRRRENDAMWQALRSQDLAGLQAALEEGANPDVRRKNRYPIQALVENTDATFVIGAWKALVGAGGDAARQTHLISTSTLATSLLGREDGALEAVWKGCPELQHGLLSSCLRSYIHEAAGLDTKQSIRALDRVIALPGSHGKAGNWVATFAGDWHRNGFDKEVAARLVAFDLHPERMETHHTIVDSFCQSVALYDRDGVVIDTLCQHHRGWLQQDKGVNGHKMVEQLIKYGDGQRYPRLHALAPHLLASDTPMAKSAMAAASFACSSFCLMPCFDADPAQALAKQGFSLEGVFSSLEPEHMIRMIKFWQLNHWVGSGGKTLVEAAVNALDRLEKLGLDVRSTWVTSIDREAEDWGEVSGSMNGVGLMHLWCAGNSVYDNTQGKLVPELAGFERATGPALLEVATRGIKDDPSHGQFLVPDINTLNWALSCGADMKHPGMALAGERILLALCKNKAHITERNAERWVAAVDWLLEQKVRMPYMRMDELDDINFERPAWWVKNVERIKIALVVANHEHMEEATVSAVAPVRAKPRL